MIVYEECPNNGYVEDSFSNDELDSDTEIENALAIINTEINEKIIRSGYLKKKGEKRKVWKRRWFVLRSNRLSYYKNEKAQSVNDRDQWIKALNSTISGKKTNAHDFLVNNNILPSSKVKNLEQKLNNLDTTKNPAVDQIQSSSNSNSNDNIFDQTKQYGSHEEIEKMNEMNDIVSQIPKINVKEDYSKVYYISSSVPKIPRSRSKSTKAVNFSTSAPSVHILMDEESDDTEDIKPEDEDEELSYEEFKKSVVRDENGEVICNNEENLEFFNSEEILNVIEKKLKYENEINLVSSPTYGNYSMAKPISMSKKEIESLKASGKGYVNFLSKEKLEEEDDEEDDDDDEEEDDNDDNDDDDDDDDMCSYDERNPMYTQRKEFLKQQMEKDVVVQQGYMYQYRKNALKKKWKKYWFVIRSGNLFIYKNEQEYVVKSIIPLENTLAICEVKRTSRIGRKGELSSSYSSSISIPNGSNNSVNNMNTIKENVLSLESTPPIKQNSISQLTNKLKSMNIEENKINIDNSSSDVNNDNNNLESNSNDNNKLVSSPNTIDIDTKKKKTTSILKINTANNNSRIPGSFDSYNSLEELSKSAQRSKRGSIVNSMSPNINMTPATPKRKTFIKVFTFSAPTETSRKIWIANLLNECEKVQENSK
ncbi:hypothetical protein PIROE2DRAFT_68474 [Piromyces sp. E2]|nr:hypothetical protein PIROE2DRAFT_68474 [Piromyces sp. E2]|eukprot:OUM69862.1 hypothetical protein PIROE2DRAFT_68474 [Piromyces sp. E2]